MPENNKKAVIWDMDGVIADTGDFHCSSWQCVFRKIGVDFSREDFRSRFGQRNDTIIRSVLGQDLPAAELDKLAQDKEEYYRREIRGKVKALPGVMPLLKALNESGFGCAVASSAPMENIRIILDSLGIGVLFQAIVFGREVQEGKPSPQIFLKAAQKLAAEPLNCVVIEDSVAGVTAAKRAGMSCIGVSNTHPAANLFQADLVVDSLEKIEVKDIERLIAGRR